MPDKFEAKVDTWEVEEAIKFLREAVGDKLTAIALRGGMRKTARKMRPILRESTPSRRIGKALARSLAYRVKTYKGTITSAKFGLGVGRKKRVAKSGKARNRPGVGLSRQNIHWAVLGTDERQTRKGAYRGAMPSFGIGLLTPAEQMLVIDIRRAILDTIDNAIKKAKAKRR